MCVCVCTCKSSHHICDGKSASTEPRHNLLLNNGAEREVKIEEVTESERASEKGS